MIGFDAGKVAQVRDKTEECYWIMGISDEEYAKLAKEHRQYFFLKVIFGL